MDRRADYAVERGDLFDSEKLTHIESSDGKESCDLQERLFEQGCYDCKE